MNLNRTRRRLVLLASTAFASAAIACGGISDPNANGGGEGTVATVSGALTGTAVPANAHVALVWQKLATTAEGSIQTSLEVAEDTPVVAGKFTLNLSVPAAEYFFPLDTHAVGSGATPPPTVKAEPDPAPAPTPSAGGSGGGGKMFGAMQGRLAPRGGVVSGSITQPLMAAIAGFVVYADTNGNGKLDLEGEYSSSPDQILGGNDELILAYLKDGGALDYEKLRDKSGILPTAGFNLSWSEGRWLPLNVVELRLSAKAQLPSAVCSSSGSYSTPASASGGTASVDPAPSGGGTAVDGGTGKYPMPTDPGLVCSPDGTSFTYHSAASCPPPPPPRVGLCAGNYGDSSEPCVSYGYDDRIPSGGPVPEGWPCTVTTPLPPSTDGGIPDAGPIMDAGAGPG